MSSEKRQRQRENRMRAVAEAERANKRSTVGRKVVRVVLIVAAILAALWLWSVFSGEDSPDSGEGDDAAVAADAEAPAVTVFETDEPRDEQSDDPSDEAPAAEVAAATTTTAAPVVDPTSCPAEDGSDGPLNQFDAPPPLCIDVETLYAASFDTNMGSFTMLLDPSLDRISVNNFIVLGRWGAYDGTLFHRVISEFVIQGGDVQLQYGSGGPGYQFTGDFPPADDWYRIGSVAMANRGNPATNGSQFFVVTGENGAGLPPLYSPLGHVVEGMDVVMEIEAVATVAGDEPLDEVVVRSVTISEATGAQIDAYTDARS